jgi:hypothetical protein
MATATPYREMWLPVIIDAIAAEANHTNGGKVHAPAATYPTSEKPKTTRVTMVSTPCHSPNRRNPAPGYHRPTPNTCHGGDLTASSTAPIAMTAA